MKYIGVSTPAWSIPKSNRKLNSKKSENDNKEKNDSEIESEFSGLKDFNEFIEKLKKEGPLNRTEPRTTHLPTKKTEDPGPGSYHLGKNIIKKSNNKKKVDFKEAQIEYKNKERLKQKLELKNYVPGPGSYSLYTSLIKKHKAEFGWKDYNPNPIERKLSPGRYNPNYQSIWKNSKGPRIRPSKNNKGRQKKVKIKEPMRKKSMIRSKSAKSENSKEKRKRNLSSLSYNSKNLLRDTIYGGTFSKFKKDSDNKKGLPGPGSYNLNHTDISLNLAKKKGYRLIGRKNNSTERSVTPGPGDYNISIFRPKSVSFQKSKRTSYKKRAIRPGPGDYNINNSSLTKATSFSLSKKPKNDKSWVPGPSDYDIDLNTFSGPKYEFNRVKNENWIDKKIRNNITAGPGYLNPLYQAIWKNQASYKISQSYDERKKLGKKKLEPGPGDYNVFNTYHFPEGPKVSMATSLRMQDEKFKTPGPGHYEIKHTIPQLQDYEKYKLDQEGRKIDLDINFDK